MASCIIFFVCVCIIFSALSFATALRRILLAQQLFTAILFIFHLTFCILARRLTTRWIACFSLCQFKTENIEQQPAPAPAPTTNDLIFSFQTPSAYENPGILSTENIHGYFDTKSNIKRIASFFTPSVSLSLCLRVCVCVCSVRHTTGLIWWGITYKTEKFSTCKF